MSSLGQAIAIGSQDKYLIPPVTLTEQSLLLKAGTFVKVEIEERTSNDTLHAYIFLKDVLGEDIAPLIAKAFVKNRINHFFQDLKEKAERNVSARRKVVERSFHIPRFGNHGEFMYRGPYTTGLDYSYLMDDLIGSITAYGKSLLKDSK